MNDEVERAERERARAETLWADERDLWKSQADTARTAACRMLNLGWEMHEKMRAMLCSPGVGEEAGLRTAMAQWGDETAIFGLNDLAKTAREKIEVAEGNAVLAYARRDQWKARALMAEAQLSFAQLREANVRRCKTHYHPVADYSLSDWLTCVAGEVGELAGVIKNIRRSETEREENGHAIPEATIEKLGDEAADVAIYLDLLCARAGVDLGEAVRRKFNLVSRDRLKCDIVLEATDE